MEKDINNNIKRNYQYELNMAAEPFIWALLLCLEVFLYRIMVL